MTPKEKAEMLVEDFAKETMLWDDFEGWVDNIVAAKSCALIAVDEILNFRNWPTYETNYLNQVKEEITKL